MNTNTTQHLEVKVANTVESQESCFKLRYEVYVGEMGYSEKSPDGMLRDNLDKSGIIFQAVVDGRTVGTLRMNFAKDCPADYQERYAFNLLSAKELASTVVVTKLMVVKEFRHSPVLIKLLNFYYDFCLESGIENHLLACSDQLLALYTKLGFVSHGKEYFHPVYGKSTPMIAKTFDYDHLASVHSPFAKRLEEMRSLSQAFAQAA
jgi:predicted GNAT family N-acyltransferase